ncbi:MAG: hypothetical protein A3B86_03365 [Candidatus Yanofskybacteria bacterium RIFCSPHIGHO2_02_FULL_38_22b]|uniref:Fatty acid desaturase domain-containing protein n=1 Tax=Candidatus Yanofskybacteria bacterium RIFCSPHIGHO2_02_FULL_38_22b TaxID=1802673 RepID=A0A1F8F001_9BACT|nr:MAG: hypothetical protein A3B86_03365 [Candidatus Yanofskybacteria bacterium RIFCSPHIGHO2_02_FULL_38_22b]OGN19426.1 MAG: hypothetical protein A2910_02745 [Candidatus Yanofskybacteria bacterium RIFCSPLOWO2_01_FULL_39_28]
MLVVNGNSGINPIIQQIITARNIKGGQIISLIYGGLNYQIEHHLFPFMPRNNLKKAKPIVEKFCQNHQIYYHETSMWQSFREIITCLQRESQVTTTMSASPN